MQQSHAQDSTLHLLDMNSIDINFNYNNTNPTDIFPLGNSDLRSGFDISYSKYLFIGRNGLKFTTSFGINGLKKPQLYNYQGAYVDAKIIEKGIISRIGFLMGYAEKINMPVGSLLFYFQAGLSLINFSDYQYELRTTNNFESYRYFSRWNQGMILLGGLKYVFPVNKDLNLSFSLEPKFEFAKMPLDYYYVDYNTKNYGTLKSEIMPFGGVSLNAGFGVFF